MLKMRLFGTAEGIFRDSFPTQPKKQDRKPRRTLYREIDRQAGSVAFRDSV
jgi:hypothetical protein